MASFRAAIQSAVFNNCKDVFRSQRGYSQFPLNYAKPIFNKDEQAQLKKDDKLSDLSHTPIYPAGNTDRCSELYDKLTQKFINYIMIHGRKALATDVMKATMENIKRIQIRTYNRVPDEEKESIELDPKAILVKAVENACPVMLLQKMKRGGITYQVPVPITAKKSVFTGIKWLIEAGNDKGTKEKLKDKLAIELIDASKNQGRVIMRKKDLYKQCEQNKAYAHYRWL